MYKIRDNLSPLRLKQIFTYISSLQLHNFRTHNQIIVLLYT